MVSLGGFCQQKVEKATGLMPRELTTPSAVLTHTIKTTAGDTPLLVGAFLCCRLRITKIKLLHRHERRMHRHTTSSR